MKEVYKYCIIWYYRGAGGGYQTSYGKLRGKREDAEKDLEAEKARMSKNPNYKISEAGVHTLEVH